MTAYEKNRRILDRLARICPQATIEDVDTLRRAELTLQRWGEQECGNSNESCSWYVIRDETNGKPYRETHYYKSGKIYMTPIADREAGALKRVKKICDKLGLHFFHQGDPRGCALYVSAEPLTDQNYHRGVAVCV